MTRTNLIFILLCSARVSAQSSVDSIPKALAVKIEPMRELVTISFTQSSDVEKLSVFSDQTKIRLSPNASTSSRLGFSYRFLSFGIRLVPRFIPGNNDNDKKGKTRSGGFSAGFNGRHWQQEFSYNRTRGYYLENTKDFRPMWQEGDPYLQFPDLVFKQYQGATAYNFNPSFSINAIVTQSERQLKSAGTFIPQLAYRYFISDDRTPLEPGVVTQKAKNFEILLGAGYYYNLVLREKIYLAGGITPAIGSISARITNRSEDGSFSGHQSNVIFRADARIGAGYNGRRFFAGAYMRYQTSRFRQRHTSVTTGDDRLTIHVSTGLRLNAPPWLKKSVDHIAQKAGLQ